MSFSLQDLGISEVLDPLLWLTSRDISTRNITSTPITSTTISRGVKTVRQTLQFAVGNRTTGISTIVPTQSLMDTVYNADITRQGDVLRIVSPPFIATNQHPFLTEQGTQVDVFGQVTQGRFEDLVRTYNLSTGVMTAVSEASSYEFFMTNPFPSDWSAAQIATAISDTVPNSCLWVIKRNVPGVQIGTITFRVTAARVVRDVRRRFSSVNTPKALAEFVAEIRNFTPQAEGNIANIFPRLTFRNGKLVNESIINGASWVGQSDINSPSGQNLVWSWGIALFNDTENAGTWAENIGPACLDIKRSDWTFFPYDSADEFTVVDSETEQARIDESTKTIYLSTKRRCVVMIQLRQTKTDKGFEAEGWTNIPNDVCPDSFYSDSLFWFGKNTYFK